ncbi:uncharacterized protein LOC143145820 [Ptiloglossa arizonensis]|uniref:uncharacterized protein LOC143145820 n=1 Tax=Ptiloglossa arizonensis TaxID=3350558 RepID=UPI003FA01499
MAWCRRWEAPDGRSVLKGRAPAPRDATKQTRNDLETKVTDVIGNYIPIARNDSKGGNARENEGNARREWKNGQKEREREVLNLRTGYGVSRSRKSRDYTWERTGVRRVDT